MKRFYSFITSLPFMSFLFLAIAFSMAIATFIESSYGTPAARAIVYRSWWFELLWALFAINLLNNIFRYRLYYRQKLTLGIFHISFLLILLGGGITRYISYEGVMHIRENTASNEILSTDDYFYAEYNRKGVEKKVIFSEFTPIQFSAKFNSGNGSFKVKSVGFIENAERKAVSNENGQPVIDFVFAVPGGQGMQSLILAKGEWIDYMGFSAVFENQFNGLIQFFQDGNSLFFVSNSMVGETTMATQETVDLPAGDTIAVKTMFLYSVENFTFLVRNFYPRASFTATKSQVETGEDAVILKISDGVREQNVTVFGKSGVVGDTVRVPLADGELKLAYGAIAKKLPFELYLKDFQLEKYPGSESPSSYASEVELHDFKTGEREDIRIFMNNTLTHGGFKFFQSSYDRDELGTVLSVNHDFWGTNITYLGYFLMILGFILTMLSRKSYFYSVIRLLKNSNALKVVVFIFLVGLGLNVHAQNGIAASIPEINDEVADKFGEIWVQGHDGRVEPLSTLSSDLIRKVSRKSGLYGRSTDKVFLSMMTWPEIWETLPIVKVANEEIATLLGSSNKYVSLQQLFDSEGNYRIVEQVRVAYNKAPSFRNKVEKEYI
ncbi:MAG: cytochrome c biogenesis protein ResB, partial [Prolixibacteraceae bacterium]|nr:cytochrome c biogenesis protein ResB [Prolixibacteraceae bacterium]